MITLPDDGKKQYESPYILALLKNRYILLIHFLVICFIAWGYAFFIVKPQFKSEIVFLPPQSESSLSSLVPGSKGLSSFLTNDIIPEQIQTIFQSKSIKREIIKKFNLIDHYKLEKNLNKVENALKQLDKELLLSSKEVQTSSISLSKTVSFSLTAYHSSSDTVYQMAKYTFCLLDSAVKAIGIDRAHRNRLFIDQQLHECKQSLDSLQRQFQVFQYKNKAFNVPDQISMSIKAYAELKATEMANAIAIKALKDDFSAETPEISALQKENRTYRRELAQLESKGLPDVMISLKLSSEILPKYENILREIEIQNQLLILLEKELEIAKIKEVKNISGLTITDPAIKPEYKSRPKRILIMGKMIVLYMLFIALFTIYVQFYKTKVKNSTLTASILSEINKNRPQG
jgi:capsule polysaccharide export protein KpsE/RkpR